MTREGCRGNCISCFVFAHFVVAPEAVFVYLRRSATRSAVRAAALHQMMIIWCDVAPTKMRPLLSIRCSTLARDGCPTIIVPEFSTPAVPSDCPTWRHIEHTHTVVHQQPVQPNTSAGFCRTVFYQRKKKTIKHMFAIEKLRICKINQCRWPSSRFGLPIRSPYIVRGY